MQFQSTPVIANGRILNSMDVQRPYCCFNPRPLLLTGESEKLRMEEFMRRVSIHARYC